MTNSVPDIKDDFIKHLVRCIKNAGIHVTEEDLWKKTPNELGRLEQRVIRLSSARAAVMAELV